MKIPRSLKKLFFLALLWTAIKAGFIALVIGGVTALIFDGSIGLYTGLIIAAVLIGKPVIHFWRTGSHFTRLVGTVGKHARDMRQAKNAKERFELQNALKEDIGGRDDDDDDEYEHDEYDDGAEDSDDSRIEATIVLRYTVPDPLVRKKVTDSFNSIQKRLLLFSKQGNALAEFASEATPLCRELFTRHIIDKPHEVLITHVGSDGDSDLVHFAIMFTAEHEDTAITHALREYCHGLIQALMVFLHQYIGAVDIKARIHSNWDFDEADEGMMTFYCDYAEDNMEITKAGLGDKILS